MNDKDIRMLYHIIVGDVLIVVNIYFLMFVHNGIDLSPNFALALITLPLAYLELWQFFNMAKRKSKKEMGK